MDITLTLPEHVAAAFPDEATAAAFAIAACTQEAQRQALAAANDAAQKLLAEAAAPFDDVTPPEVPTLAERVEAAAERIDEVAMRTVILAGALATLPSVGGDPAEVEAAITQVIGTK